MSDDPKQGEPHEHDYAVDWSGVKYCVHCEEPTPAGRSLAQPEARGACPHGLSPQEEMACGECSAEKARGAGAEPVACDHPRSQWTSITLPTRCKACGTWLMGPLPEPPAASREAVAHCPFPCHRCDSPHRPCPIDGRYDSACPHGLDERHEASRASAVHCRLCPQECQSCDNGTELINVEGGACGDRVPCDNCGGAPKCEGASAAPVQADVAVWLRAPSGPTSPTLTAIYAEAAKRRAQTVVITMGTLDRVLAEIVHATTTPRSAAAGPDACLPNCDVYDASIGWEHQPGCPTVAGVIGICPTCGAKDEADLSAFCHGHEPPVPMFHYRRVSEVEWRGKAGPAIDGGERT